MKRGGSWGGSNPLAGFITGGNAGEVFSGLQADLSKATAATINAIRTAFQVQRLLERDARGGTRIRKLFVLILASFRLVRVSSVLNIWGVLVFLSILRLSRKLLLLLSAGLLHPRVIFLLLVLCFLSLVLHNHLLSMALS